MSNTTEGQISVGEGRMMNEQLRVVGKHGVRVDSVYYAVDFPPLSKVKVTINDNKILFTLLDEEPSRCVEHEYVSPKGLYKEEASTLERIPPVRMREHNSRVLHIHPPRGNVKTHDRE